MGKAEAGTPKAIANAIKAKGLGRLRWYCQICEKQCRDENGFQAHCRSEPHMRKMMIVGPKAGQTIADFSRQFQYEFVTLLRTRHNTVRVRANAVYNEYIQDKHHVHMNATRWVTLSGFIMTLGKAGIVKVDEDEQGLWIQWIDSTPQTLAKQAALQKRERAEMDGEERERAVLEEQIARARAALPEEVTKDAGLQKAEGEKISLSLNLNTNPNLSPLDRNVEAEAGPSTISLAPTETSETSKSTISFGSISKPSVAPVTITNPLKRPAPVNVFKSSKMAKTEGEGREGEGQKSRPGYVSEVERLMKEDQARKARGPQGYQGFGPRRGK
ncbi:DNA/RNA-binding protein KIN17 [Tremella mesenterica]|uniref:DNA/RNA-binding protein KIN17 n=1 Tax=Tremella mesenterica TaxID=5217 RepID=A0A4Q1BCP1_TREME|nr:uncharacterized protein TREMEDRAFT_28285 [Tremella mesenterica DSM 1558]EIW71446.1 hypothetical protein TREMEDRAFT_28285 [Tremella mesenterica DSM 1558]RXK36608.1 DNA/RNA-binding protein KIN17 [Tremella mesenterica]